MSPWTAIRERPSLLAFGMLATIVVAFPFVFSGRFEIGAAIAVGAMAISAVGFILLIGYAHQLALGQAAFCLIGGYTSAILTLRHGWDPALAMAVGVVLSMIVAYVLGKPILKLRGFVLAMASLAFQLILVFVGLEAVGFTGGAEGLPGVPKFGAFGQTFESDRTFYFVAWAMVVGSLLIGLNIDRSGIGRALKAIASSETAAGSSGIDVTEHKVQMFVLSASLASVTGSLMVHYLRIMDPHIFGFVFSLTLITAVIIGGLASIWGGVLGAAVMVILRESLRDLKLPLWEIVIMGTLTVCVLLLFREGLAGAIGAIYRRFVPARLLGPGTGSSAAPLSAVSTIGMVDAVATPGPVLALDNVGKSFGSLAAVSDVSFTVAKGSITALIGPNGAGKTTLFNLISGFLPLDHGTIRHAGRPIERLLPFQIARLGVGRTFQNLQLFENLTVAENVMCGCHARLRSALPAVVFAAPSVRRHERQLRGAAQHWLEFVGLDAVGGRSPGTLPFGHQRKLEIARALAASPTLLLMDEPASGLNDSETEDLADLIARIRNAGTTVLIVEHDMRLVMGLADHIVVMNYGSKIAEGAPDAVRANSDVVTAYLGRSK